MSNFSKRGRLGENSEFLENGFMVIFEVIHAPTDHITNFPLFLKESSCTVQHWDLALMLSLFRLFLCSGVPEG